MSRSRESGISLADRRKELIQSLIADGTGKFAVAEGDVTDEKIDIKPQENVIVLDPRFFEESFVGKYNIIKFGFSTEPWAEIGVVDKVVAIVPIKNLRKYEIFKSKFLEIGGNKLLPMN